MTNCSNLILSLQVFTAAIRGCHALLSPRGAGDGTQGQQRWEWAEPAAVTLGFEANTLVQGTLGEPGTGRAGAQGLMLTCPSAWEHSTERG